MRVGFVETLRGALRPERADGALESACEAPCEVTLAVAAPSVRALVTSGKTTARGVVRVAPWARAAPCDGEIVLSVRPPRIAYRLAFEADDGERLVLTGEKSVRALALLRTMTTLPVLLSVESGPCAGVVRARGALLFSLGDLPAFLRSWVPLADRQAAAVARARVGLVRAELEG